MNNILSTHAWNQLKVNGYARTGLTLSSDTLKTMSNLLASPNIGGSPWSFFITHSDIRKIPRKKWLSRALQATMHRFYSFFIHQKIKRQRYKQTIYGSSKVLKLVFEECLKSGITKNFINNYLLVGHDIFLENRAGQIGFGFHEDNINLEEFYSSDDDLSLHIQLQDVDKSTGGRLYVDPTHCQSQRFKQRNQSMKEFSNACEKLGCVDDDGYANREIVLKSKAAVEIFKKIKEKRQSLPKPQIEDLRPIDAKAGEIILFNNRSFHNNEPWLAHNKGKRAVYIVRLSAIYDIKLRPPWNFLQGSPCNRFILDVQKERLIALDSKVNPLEKYASPMPPLDS